MKKVNFFLALMFLVCGTAFGASRNDSAVRLGVGRPTQTGSRMPAVTALTMKSITTAAATTTEQKEEKKVENTESAAETSSDEVVKEETKTETSSDCRTAYRDCMDQFCLLDESQGGRCACSDNIDLAKSKIQAVLKIQAEADKLFTEGVEREELGAKARLVFAENTNNTRVSVANFMSWLNDGTDEEDDDDADVGEDVTLGDDLYKMAAKYCVPELEKCESKAEMETMLYTRMIARDCKSYDAYLKDQKSNAESNKRIAESAVRKARLGMLEVTNKYNRGECLLAYRACISDKGGCGVNFENCLDSKLLARRSNACENVLDQCMAVRDYVKQDWAAESKSVLKEAEKYADKYKRQTCLAQIQNCLEEGCSTTTNTECLSDFNVAAGVCPIITECDAMIPGLQTVVNDKLGYLRTKFCENDIDKCLQDKCGVDFTKAECVGKSAFEISKLCPQTMFPSCKNAEHYNIIVQSVLLQMDYQMMQGCINYFDEQLSKVCGTDMACLPIVSSATSFVSAPKTEKERNELTARIVADSDASVEEFFKQFEQEKTVVACSDTQSIPAKKVKGKQSLGVSVFNTAKLLAKMSAENRNLREMDSRIAELARKEDIETARQTCLTTYKPETPKDSKTNYSYIHTVSFESDLRNCHVCRIQQVCEEGGESKMATAAKYAGAGGSMVGSAGATINPIWGTLIGGVVGAVGVGALGYATADGKQQYCQEIESCEDINM